MNEIYLIIGGNLGNKLRHLSIAGNLIEKRIGTITKASSVFETAPWGMANQPPFYNQALFIETDLDASAAMKQILEIEKEMGRVRTIKYGSRIIDIDILFFNDEIMSTGPLTLPHPKMQDRKFVLAPLAEIAGNKTHPVLKKNITTLLKECTDILRVRKLPPGA